jgi:hypothetical protein
LNPPDTWIELASYVNPLDRYAVFNSFSTHKHEAGNSSPVSASISRPVSCVSISHRCPKCSRKVVEISGVQLSCSYCGWRERP